MTSPFAAARVTVKTFMRDDGSSAPQSSADWHGVLSRYSAVAVDHGWLRLLGAGGHGLPPLFTPAHPAPVTGGAGSSSSRRLVGFDVLGGTFAVSHPAGPGVEYFAPDGLAWLDLGLDGLDAFVDWALAGGLDDAFDGLRWPGWRDEIRFLAPDQGVSVYPPLWSEEGQDVGAATRGVTPLLDLVAAHREAAEQLAEVRDGEHVNLRITD